VPTGPTSTRIPAPGGQLSTVTEVNDEPEDQAPRTHRTPHPVDEVLPVPKLALYGFQHVLAFYAGAVIVPILLAGAIGHRDGSVTGTWPRHHARDNW
jgi:hypothetical protein